MQINKSKKVPKDWGAEEWLCNNELYCGKLMTLMKDKFCSFHYHKVKTEDFFVIRGKVKLEYQYVNAFTGELEDKRDFLMLNVGDSVHILPFMAHRFTGMDDPASVFIETSTQHFDEDSYRLEAGCGVEEAKIVLLDGGKM